VSGTPLAVTLPTNRTRRPTKAFLPFKSILDREMDYPNQAKENEFGQKKPKLLAAADRAKNVSVIQNKYHYLPYRRDCHCVLILHPRLRAA
jgi:hypothetical protein